MATVKQKSNPDDETIHYVAPRKKQAKASPKMQPPLTPMIDVTFQLLLYFILTASAKTLEGELPGSLPSDLGQLVETQKPPLEPDILVRMRLEGASRESVVYEVSGAHVAFSHPNQLYEEFKKRIDEKVASRDKTPVRLHPDMDVPYQFVNDAYNQALRVQFKKISFRMQN